MKFTQFQSHMIPATAQGQVPIIGLFALGEDGFIYQYNRTSPTNQWWEKLSNDVKMFEAPELKGLSRA